VPVNEGQVRFFNGTAYLGQASVHGGRAVLRASTMTVGTNKLTAYYMGSSQLAASTSSPVSVTVEAAPTKTTLFLVQTNETPAQCSGPPPDPSRLVFRIKVATKGHTRAVPNGRLEVLRDGKVIRTMNVKNGHATWNVSRAWANFHVFRVRYRGASETR